MLTRGWGLAQLIENLPRMLKALGSIFSAAYIRPCGQHTCNPRTQEVEEEGSEVQGHPQLNIVFKVSLQDPDSNQNFVSHSYPAIPPTQLLP